MVSTFNPAIDPAAQVVDLVKRCMGTDRAAGSAARIEPALLRFVEAISESPRSGDLADCARALRCEALAQRRRATDSEAGPILTRYCRDLADALDAAASLLGHYRTGRPAATDN